ncbi:hypothetical protein Zm00014a_015045 [Zea mays]|uniref:Uncharacterized protein n=1 Tax=Zea mays TaxID=4577 RepID=A0A3L6GA85_MAIZE|nr:hypothetical protein Zm00014a_015045 [Zea mays]
MADLVAVGIKRKDAEVGSHGFPMLLGPKRIKLEDEAEIPEPMEEEEPLADVDADAGAAPVVVQAQPAVSVSMPSPSPLQPAQGHEEAAVLREPQPGLQQAAPMDVEEDFRQPQPQPGLHPRFWSVLMAGAPVCASVQQPTSGAPLFQAAFVTC